MTIEGNISELDFARLNWSLFCRKPTIALLFLGVLCLSLFYSAHVGWHGVGAILPWSPLIVPIGLYFMVTHNAKRKYRASKTLRSHLRYTLADDGIRVGSDGSEAVLAWDQFARWMDSRRFLMLHSVQGQAFLVDKAWFGGDSAALQRFIEALDRRRAPSPRSEDGNPPAFPPADAEKA